MKIVMSGASGLIGTATTDELTRAGHTVERARTPRPEARAEEESAWREAVSLWSASTFESVDALVSLGGEPIYGLWTASKKKRIVHSRYFPAHAMAQAAAGMERKPRVIVAASASGFYGDTGDTPTTEESPKGSGYLSGTTSRWESAWDPAREAGIRVVTVRLGVVLSPRGGALKVMLPFFKLGLGGRIGSGEQWFGWISLEDTARLIAWAVENEQISGPLNATAPEPVKNRDFTQALARAVHRPALVPIPAFALRTLTGSIAEEVLSSKRVLPQKALDHGFKFSHPTIEHALSALISKPGAG